MSALAPLQEQLKAACDKSPLCIRPPELIAVSKSQSAESIEPLLVQGHRHFGENRVQEAAQKWPALKARYCDVILHGIGALQTNKARDAIALFDVIHTLDRQKLAEALAKAEQQTGIGREYLIQVNTGAEPQKAGVAPADAPALLAQARDLGLNVIGLMVLPPQDQPPAPHFALLHKMAGELGLASLSMGMSADYNIAVDFGATYVRIGTALFGQR